MKIAVLWDKEIKGRDQEKPFNDNGLNEAYEFFSEIAQQKGKKLLISRFDSYNNGELEYAYVFENGAWNQIESVEFDAVYDKYRFDEETIKIKKRIEKRFPVINIFDLEEICKDKFLTYKEFPDYVPPTYEPTEENVQKVIERFGRAVLKPRFDFGGKGIEIAEKVSESEHIGKPDYIVQAFVDTTEGIDALGFNGVHDLRIIGVSGEPVLSFVRTQDEGLISNVSQGGEMKFVELEDIPESAFELFNGVAERFDEYEPNVFALDIAFDDENRPWILEINSKPGLKVYGDDEIKNRKSVFMNRIIDSFE